MIVYVVSYRDKDIEEPVLTAFINEKAAIECRDYFSAYHDFVWLDSCKLHNGFQIIEGEN